MGNMCQRVHSCLDRSGESIAKEQGKQGKRKKHLKVKPKSKRITDRGVQNCFLKHNFFLFVSSRIRCIIKTGCSFLSSSCLFGEPSQGVCTFTSVSTSFFIPFRDENHQDCSLPLVCFLLCLVYSCVELFPLSAVWRSERSSPLSLSFHLKQE